MRIVAAALVLVLAAPALAQQATAIGAPTAAPVLGDPAVPAIPAKLAASGYGKAEGLIPGMVIGPKLSLFTVPAPGFGLEAKVLGVVGLSFDYDLIPDVSLGNVKAGYRDWNVAAKWYPTHRSFFLGAALGSRSFKASATDGATGLSASAEVASTYLAPEIGWRWVWDSGLFLGMDLGYQIVVSSKTTLTLPGGSYPADMQKDVKDAGDQLGKLGFPIVSLLQIGWFI